MNENEFIKINISISPPAEIAERAIKLCNEVATQSQPLFILDGVNYLPHITVYPIECPRKNISEIIKMTEELAKELGKPKLVFTQPGSLRGYMAIYFELSPEVKKFQEKIIEKINPLRENHRREKYDEALKQSDLPEDKKENILKYGYPDLLNLYNPHLTITRLGDEDLAKNIAKSFKWDAPSFVVDKIAVFESGKGGTCSKLIKEFDLK